MNEMTDQQKREYYEQINNNLHRIGRFMAVVGVVTLVSFPFFIASYYGVSIDWAGLGRGFLNVGLIYIPVGIVEFLVFTPMVGVGGSYLSFLTGNLTNLKIPCAMNARDIARTQIGTPENEIVSTISIAVSALTTMVVLFVGVLLIVPLTPVLEAPALQPAFDNVVAALFGALGLKYFIKQPKVAAIPLITMTLLCVLVPSMISQTSILIIPAGLMALVIGYLLFKKDKLNID